MHVCFASQPLAKKFSRGKVGILVGNGFDLEVRITVLSGPAGGYVTVDGTTILVGDYDDFGIQDSVELTSGDVAGPPDYAVRVEVTDSNDEGTVDGIVIDGYGWTSDPDTIDVTLTTVQTLPEGTIAKITTTAYVDITNNTPNVPPDPNNNITVDGTTIQPGETLEDVWYSSANPSDTISGADPAGTYEVTITCTDGMVTIDYGSSSVVLGEPGTLITNGTYTVGSVEADRGLESGEPPDGGSSKYQWAYAGWSLIIMYSSPSEEAHQLFLYDNFLYADQYTTHTFTITGFLAPSDSGGMLTAFVGEGDEQYDDDYIKFNDNYLSDAINPWDNVWNGQSSGLGGLDIDGVDIDNFDVASYLTEGDTSAVVEMGTDIEIWNVVYLFLSFRSDAVAESGASPVGIISYGPGGS